MVREILFATDFSAPSEIAWRVAHDYARQLNAGLHLLHVAPAQASAAPEGLTELAAEAGAGLKVVTAVRIGAPTEEIVRYAAEQGVDLIVVGTHGRTGVTRALLGSVAENVTRHAPCPVLTVPHGAVMAEPVKQAEHAEPPPSLRRCLICSKPSEDLICVPCRAQIRGEALERKHEVEKKGRT